MVIMIFIRVLLVLILLTALNSGLNLIQIILLSIFSAGLLQAINDYVKEELKKFVLEIERRFKS